MAYRHTRISNLKYIDEVFHNMAHNIPHPNEQGYEGHDDNTLQKWECVDDRFSTGYGSTYEVPVTDFPKREEEVEITIFGDTWLHVETVPYEEHFMDKWETTEVTERVGRVPYKESLPEVLERVYPNGTVNLVGDFSSSAIDLDDVWNYLQGLSTYPDYFIFNGASLTQANNGKAYTIQKIKDIDGFCKQNKIKACCVFTENKHLVGISVKDWAEVFSTTTKMLKFSTLEWATHHLSLLETNYSGYGNETDLDVLFGDNDLTINKDLLYVYITNKNLDGKVECYKELIYTIIKRFILEHLFILHRECFYITLLYKSVDSNTYDYYFGTDNRPYNLMCNFNKNDHTVILSTNSELHGHHDTKYGEDSSWNIFKQDGQFISFCLHTGYSENQWAWQQGQSSCFEEWSQLRNYTAKYKNNSMFKDRDTENPANLLKEHVWMSGASSFGESAPVSPPIFVGTGCSMLTISKDNRDRYKNKLGFECPVDIWITRDNYTASITIRVHSEKGYPDVYQSIEFGKLSSVETDNYIYPLYCGGGSTGLACDIYVYTPVGSSGGGKMHLEGNVYDSSIDNICMSNTNILHPTKFYNCKFTNFKVLAPDGVWRSIYSHEQDVDVANYPSLGMSPDFAVYLTDVVHNCGQNSDCAYPYLLDNRNTIGSQHIKNRNWSPREPVDNKENNFSSRLDSVRIALNHNVGHGQYLSYGTIPYCWRSWDKEIPSGEFVIGTKKYLAVPCGWDGRLYNYGHHLAIYNDTWEAESVIDEFEDCYYAKNARIDDKLIIELGDVDV